MKRIQMYSRGIPYNEESDFNQCTNFETMESWDFIDDSWSYLANASLRLLNETCDKLGIFIELENSFVLVTFRLYDKENEREKGRAFINVYIFSLLN